MKKPILFYIPLFLISSLLLSNASLAQDYTEWHLPEGVKMRLGKGKIKKINTLKFSPDDTQLAVATSIGVWLFDVKTDAEIISPNEKLRDIATIAFSPDGSKLATGARHGTWTVQVWDTTTGKELATMDGDIDWVFTLVFSADGKTLAGAGGGATFQFYIWDVNTGREVSNFIGQQDSINGGGLIVSPDHRFVASAGGNKVFLWDTRTGKRKHTVEGDTDLAWTLAFSPDSKTLAGGYETIRLWDTETGDELSELKGHTRLVRSLAFSSDSKILASGDSSGKIILWDFNLHRQKTENQKPTLPDLLRSMTRANRTLTAHILSVDVLDFTTDGKTLVSGSWDGTVLVWNLESILEKNR